MVWQSILQMSNEVLQGLSHANTLIFIFAAIYLYLNMQKYNSNSEYLGTFIWVSHAALYFSFASMLRIFFDYHGPSEIISLWGGAVFLHGAFSVIGATYVRNKYEEQINVTRILHVDKECKE